MNIKKFSIIFVLSLSVIPGTQADFMTYFLNYTHLPTGPSLLKQTQYDEKDAFLSELAMNPSYSLPGTQEEFENPFNKLFELQTQEWIKNKNNHDSNNTLNLTLWKLFNYSVSSEGSAEDELDNYLFEIENPTFELLETDIGQNLSEGDSVEQRFVNPDADSEGFGRQNPASEKTSKMNPDMVSKDYSENEYLKQAALNYFTGDSFVEALYGRLNTQLSVPNDYIYEISQKYAPAMLKLQLPMNAETLKSGENNRSEMLSSSLIKSESSYTDRNPVVTSDQQIADASEPIDPVIRQPYNP